MNACSSHLEGRMVALMKTHCKSRRIMTKRSWGLLRVSRLWCSIWMSSRSRQNTFGRKEVYELRCFFPVEGLTCEKLLEKFNKKTNAFSESEIVLIEDLQRFCSETLVSKVEEDPCKDDCCGKVVSIVEKRLIPEWATKEKLVVYWYIANSFSHPGNQWWGCRFYQ